MSVDLSRILSNLISFYNFSNKTVVHVGAGGGALINYAYMPEKIYAVDNNKESIELLEKETVKKAYKDKLSIICADFCDTDIKCDIVLFEFCLHEMNNPQKAIEHARKLSPEIVIIDHLPESKWSWYTLETEKLNNSWNAVRENKIKKEIHFKAIQSFRNYDELKNKTGALGSECIKRIEPFKEKTDIKIEMPYSIVLLKN